MAGDWLKVEVDLPDKPEVWEMADILGLDPDAVVGKLLKVWRWFDAHTVDGNAAGVTYALLDSKSGVTGFAEAMALVGWLAQNDRTLCLPKFDRHNGKTAKNRALTAKRVKKNRNADVTLEALPREEKRREEEKQEQPRKRGALPDGVEQSVWEDWLALRKSKKAPVTQTVLDGAKREAHKAGMTLNEFLKEWCVRGSQGLKADWMAPRTQQAGAQGHERPRPDTRPVKEALAPTESKEEAAAAWKRQMENLGVQVP